jgi:hypothetical protein
MMRMRVGQTLSMVSTAVMNLETEHQELLSQVRTLERETGGGANRLRQDMTSE